MEQWVPAFTLLFVCQTISNYTNKRGIILPLLDGQQMLTEVITLLPAGILWFNLAVQSN